MKDKLKQRANAWARTAWDETDLADSDKTDPKILALVRAASSMGYFKGWEDAVRLSYNNQEKGILILLVVCLCLAIALGLSII